MLVQARVQLCIVPQCRSQHRVLREDVRFRGRELWQSTVLSDRTRGLRWSGGPDRNFGLRAVQSFAPGQLVGEYVGEIVEQCDLRTWQYAMLLKSGVAIDASRAGGLIRFMNHSCSPNCEAQRWAVDAEWRVGLFALRHISCGEELTFSYASGGRGGFGEDGVPERCCCGAQCCSGYIEKAAVESESRDKLVKGKGAKGRGRRPKLPTPASLLAARQGLGVNQSRRKRALQARQRARWLRCFMFDQQHSPGERSECEGVRATPLLRASCAYRLEPLLAHVWQSSQELENARIAGVFLPRSVALGRHAWAKRMRAILPSGMASLMCKTLLEREPCAGCGVSSGSQCCGECGVALHGGCAPAGEDPTPRSGVRFIQCMACKWAARSRDLGTRHERLADIFEKLRACAEAKTE